MFRYLGIDMRTIRPRYVGPELRRYPDGRFDTYWGIQRGGGCAPPSAAPVMTTSGLPSLL